MRVIQINAWLRRLLPTLLIFIKEQGADIVCTQEILSSSKDNPLVETFQTLEHIKREGEFKDVFFSPTSSFEAFGEEVFLGNAIFSKHSILNKQTIFTSEEYHPKQLASSFVRNIRNLQVCELELPNSSLIHIVISSRIS